MQEWWDLRDRKLRQQRASELYFESDTSTVQQGLSLAREPIHKVKT
jgi:hypothetical protein